MKKFRPTKDQKNILGNILNKKNAFDGCTGKAQGRLWQRACQTLVAKCLIERETGELTAKGKELCSEIFPQGSK